MCNVFTFVLFYVTVYDILNILKINWILYILIIIIFSDKDDKDEEEITQDEIEEEIENGTGILTLPPGKVRAGKKGIKKGTNLVKKQY